MSPTSRLLLLLSLLIFSTVAGCQQQSDVHAGSSQSSTQTTALDPTAAEQIQYKKVLDADLLAAPEEHQQSAPTEAALPGTPPSAAPGAEAGTTWSAAATSYEGRAQSGKMADRSRLGFMMLHTMSAFTYRMWQQCFASQPTAEELLSAGTYHFALQSAAGEPTPFVALPEGLLHPQQGYAVQITSEALKSAYALPDSPNAQGTWERPLSGLAEPLQQGGIWEDTRSMLLALQMEVLLLATVKTLGRIPQDFDEVLFVHNLMPLDVTPDQALPQACSSGVIARVQASPPALYLEVRRPDGIVDSRIIEYLLDQATGTVKIKPVAAADVPESAEWPVLVALDLTPSSRPEWLVPAIR